MSNSLALQLPHILPAQAQKHVTHNEAIDWLDTLVHLAVQSRSQTAPPATPANGDRYLVTTTATGDWLGHDDELALFLDGGWVFRMPNEGWRVWVEDEQALLVRDATGWQPVGGGNGSPVNAVINGAMEIWQRGVGPHAGTSAGVYGADRWKMHATGAASIQISRDTAVPSATFRNSAYCQVAGLSPTDQVTLTQTVEGGAQLTATGDVTLSFYLRGPNGAHISFGINGNTVTHSCTGNWDLVSSTFSGLLNLPNGHCIVTLLSNLTINGGYGITGVQLVSGGRAGGFPYRPRGDEEALCRRYFERLGGLDRQLGRSQNAFGSTVSLHPVLHWTTPKRIAPNVTVLGDVNDGPQQTLGTHFVGQGHVVIDQQVPAFGWLDIDAMDVDAEF